MMLMRSDLGGAGKKENIMTKCKKNQPRRNILISNHKKTNVQSAPKILEMSPKTILLLKKIFFVFQNRFYQRMLLKKFSYEPYKTINVLS
jgi:hypothetical protein